MINKKKGFILFVSIIIFIQILLTVNNSQKNSFRYFIWKINEIKIGKLISISFFSGFILSSFLNANLTSKNKLTSYKEKNFENNLEEENYNSNEDDKTSLEVPPQRDVRDAQPTISVNYRIIKNNTENDYKKVKNSKDTEELDEDWEIIDNNDW
tara:strand:+ start:566 stop:1027 length:462 start_codon:yes stop_codon:yes gene_type:complete